MAKESTQDIVRHYYGRLGTRLGYILVMGRSQHFGYYNGANESEKTAQTNYHQKLGKLLKLRNDMTVLDAGCGQGVVATYLAQNHSISVTGITIVPHEVKNARRRARKAGVADTTVFEIADYQDLPFPDETFDRVYTTETLSHAPDVNQALKEFYRVLKPGGKAVFVEYEVDFLKLNKDTLEALDFAIRGGGLHGLSQFGIGEFEKNITRTGFSSLRVTDWTQAVLPSFRRIRKTAQPIAWLVRKLRLESMFFNTVVARGYADLTEMGAFNYKVYAAAKPRNKQ